MRGSVLRSIGLFVLSVSLGGWLIAQEERLIEFSTLVVGEIPDWDLYFESEFGEVLKLNWSNEGEGRSEVYRGKLENGILPLFRFVSTKDGKRIREMVDRIDFAGVKQRGLAVCLGAESDRSARLRFVVADEAEESFPNGSFRILNLSGVSLRTEIGDLNFVLGRGFSEAIRFDGSESKPVRIGFSARIKDRWVDLFSTARQPNPLVPSLFVLRPPLDPRSLMLRVEVIERLVR